MKGRIEMTDRVIIHGFDNNKKPRQNYADDLAAMSDDDFIDSAKLYIWLSAYANNNPRSDYHWKAGACEDEAKRRGKPELFRIALAKARSDSN